MFIISKYEFPPEEQKQSEIIDHNIQNLGKYIVKFWSAVSLFEFALSQHSPDDDRERIELLSSWRQLAARDGAMTIFHFGKALNGARNGIRLCPIACASVDRSKLKSASRLFNSYFANHESLRHAVAHSAELRDSNESYKKNAFSGSHATNGIEITNCTDVFIQDFLSGRTFTTTHEGRIFSYEISGDMLGKLLEIEGLFCSAFGALVQAVPPYVRKLPAQRSV